MRFLFFAFFLIPLCLLAQKDCYGSFELFGAGGISNDWGAESTNGDYVPISTYRMGFGASFKVGRRTLVRTSMQFNTYGDQLRIVRDGLMWGTQHDGSGGFDPTVPAGEPELPETIKLNTRHLFVELGVSVRHYPRVRSRVRPFGELGLDVGRYGTTMSSSNLSDESGTRRVAAFRRFSPIARAGIGVDLPFGDRVAVYGMVAGQQHLRSLQERELVRVQPWQVDLEVGVRVFVDPR